MKPVSTKLLTKWKELYTRGEKAFPKGLWYRNFEGIRRTNIRFLYTQSELVEKAKCINDITYFVGKYAKARISTGEVKPIVLRDYQKDLLRSVQDTQFNVIESSRQTGATTMQIFDLIYRSQIKGEPCIMIGHNKNATRYLFDMYKLHYVHMPFFLKQGVQRMSIKHIELEDNNAVVFATLDTFAQSYQSLKERGDKPVNIYISDMQFIPISFIKPIANVIAKLDTDRIVITGKRDKHSYILDKIIRDAKRPFGDPSKNKFTYYPVGYYKVPGRDKKWVDMMVKTLGSYEAFKLEYDIEYPVIPRRFTDSVEIFPDERN